MERPRVTAVITTYKRPWRMITRAIQSILNQTLPVYELLLIDDNDEESEYSRDIRAHLGEEPRVTYVPMGKNAGVSGARNRAIQEAKGELIGYLDDDDEWAPRKLELLVPLFEEEPSLGIAFGTGLVIYHDTGKQSRNWQWEVFRERPGFEDMLFTDYVGSASAPLLRREALEHTGGFLTQGQPAVEDYELWIRIAASYPVRGVKDTVFIKHNETDEHVSGSLKKLSSGFKNIYRINREAYRRDPRLRLAILWNICRCGVRGYDPRVVPYVLEWMAVKVTEPFIKRH